MNSIEISHLTKRYGDVTALDDISLNVRKGIVFGLLGPNGAGKTTLISILVGLSTADSGKVTIEGLDAWTQMHDIRKRINMMRGFTEAPSGLDSMELMEYYMRLYECWDRKKAKKLLEGVLLGDVKGQVHDFSSGLRQRFFFAKALCNDPDVIFLDEPTVGLDVDSAIAMRKQIATLRDQGKTVLLTTHYLLEADELCDEIALINKGKIIAQGTPSQLKNLVKDKEIIRITTPDCGNVIKAIRKIHGVKNPEEKSHYVEAEITDWKAYKKVLSALSTENSVKVTAIEMVEPPLEEAFIKLVNRK